jgi:hypothetical protein
VDAFEANIAANGHVTLAPTSATRYNSSQYVFFIRGPHWCAVMTKVAIVGATGPTGIHLAAELRQTAAAVRVIARSIDKLTRLFPDAAVDGGSYTRPCGSASAKPKPPQREIS